MWSDVSGKMKLPSSNDAIVYDLSSKKNVIQRYNAYRPVLFTKHADCQTLSLNISILFAIKA